MQCAQIMKETGLQGVDGLSSCARCWILVAE
jgi:hypothetical protein